MSTLWFMNYNNYANRIVKKESSLNVYGTAGRNVFNKPKIDFNPNDGVTTTLIVDASAGYNPDYMLVVDTINNVETITSRWFVIEWTRTRGGQYRASLKRDALIDNLDTIASSPILVQKGTVKNTDDICIYQKENIEYNQIKKDEILLKDRSLIGWIVGFFTDPHFAKGNQSLSTDYGVKYNQSYNGINNYPYKQYTDSNPYYYYDRADTNIMVSKANIDLGNFSTWDFDKNGDYTETTGLNRKNGMFVTSTAGDLGRFAGIVRDNQREMEQIIFTNYTSINKQDLLAVEDGQIIRDTSTSPISYYRVSVVKTAYQMDNTITSGSETEEEVCEYLETLDSNFYYNATSYQSSVKCRFYGYKTYVVLTQLDVDTLSCTFPTGPTKLNDAPYYMFAIPYGSVYLYKTGMPGPGESTGFNTCSKEIALNIARNLVDELGGNVNDVQLLPFCPIPSIIKGDDYAYYLSIYDLEQQDYVILEDGANRDKAIIFFPDNSSFKGEIPLHILTTKNINVPVDVEDFKVENETKKFRLTSPNFASTFEFKNTYNQTNIKTFNFRCTYKPYNSFVNVYPKEIGGLYGKDYRDNFGLIFQGDFSLPILNNSEWKNYQINNKNYQNSFNRSIDTFDLEAKWAKRQDIVGAISGTITGTAQGALAGGAGPGAIAGAIIGGVASAGAGAMDIIANEQMRQNKRGEMIDQFNFSLENVQARPRTIANVGTFDINNKIFPILEIFDCTDGEKEILRMKLRYTGYTINKIAYLSDYMGGYFKGVVIFNENIDEDSHVQEVINEELGKGVYTNGLSI